MTAITPDIQFNNTLTSEGVFKIVKFTSSADNLPTSMYLGSPGSGKTWLNLGGNSSSGTAIIWTISGSTATIAAGIGLSENGCNLKLGKY